MEANPTELHKLILSLFRRFYHNGTADVAGEVRSGKKQRIFQGCFADEAVHLMESITTESNNNLFCSERCRDKGYIIALTKEDMCGCSNVLPGKQLGRPDEAEAAGIKSACKASCPAAKYVQGTCRGDECCGGKKAYSVHSVGGKSFYSIY